MSDVQKISLQQFTELHRSGTGILCNTCLKARQRARFILLLYWW